MAEVRIIAVPPGEAPPEVRAKWVGLCLPVRRTLLGRSRRSVRAIGVLTGPRTLGCLLRALFTGEPVEGYAVPVLPAIAILERSHPEAAAWWRANTPHLLRRGQHFVFSAEVCAEVES